MVSVRVGVGLLLVSIIADIRIGVGVNNADISISIGVGVNGNDVDNIVNISIGVSSADNRFVRRPKCCLLERLCQWSKTVQCCCGSEYGKTEKKE